MLEHVPQWLGHALRGLRAGADKLCILQPDLGGCFAPIQLSSPAFADGGRLPPRFTADGEGVSPPLLWGPVPPETRCLALIVEDPDAPSIEPLVHAVVWGISPLAHRLAEGGIRPDSKREGGDGAEVGRNSYFFEGWLPPDPPPGHGDHHYAFQLFALGECSDPGTNPRRGTMVKAMRGNVLAAGLLTGTYSRGDPAMIGKAKAAARVPLGRSSR